MISSHHRSAQNIPTRRTQRTRYHITSYEWLHAVGSLKDLTAVYSENIYHRFKPAVQAAFSATYMDPCNAVEYCIQQLQKWMTEWQKFHQCIMRHIPVWSIATSMGNSRLIKQITIEIPTVYICLRENDDGYPHKSSTSLVMYITKPPYSSTTSLETNENTIELHLLALFCSLFEETCEWCHEYVPSQQVDRKSRRKRLWYRLGEVEKREYKDMFWDSVISTA